MSSYRKLSFIGAMNLPKEPDYYPEYKSVDEYKDATKHPLYKEVEHLTVNTPVTPKRLALYVSGWNLDNIRELEELKPLYISVAHYYLSVAPPKYPFRIFASNYDEFKRVVLKHFPEASVGPGSPVVELNKEKTEKKQREKIKELQARHLEENERIRPKYDICI